MVPYHNELHHIWHLPSTLLGNEKRDALKSYFHKFSTVSLHCYTQNKYSMVYESSQAAITKMPQTEQLKQKTFLPVMEAGSLKSGCQHGLVWIEGAPLLEFRQLSVSSHGRREL